MKKETELMRELTELTKETRAGRIHWDIQYQTTEYNDPAQKPVEEEDGAKWIVDECFVGYHCIHHDKEFLLITYEQFYTCGDKKKSCNLIFLPPDGAVFSTGLPWVMRTKLPSSRSKLVPLYGAKAL